MALLKPKPAQRVAMKARIAIRGPSGSGKTVTALRLAQGIGGRVLVIDTEGGKANLYADTDFGDGIPAYDVAPLDTFKMSEFPAMMAEAATMADVIVIDSLSAWWMGQGGALDFVDNANTRNSMDAWRGLKPIERAMWAAIQASPAHVIATLRTKTEWDLSSKDARGKVQPRKVGTKAEQREGFEYEFDIVLDLDRETHTVRADKTRWSALDDLAERNPGAKLGRAIGAWLDSGAPAPPPAPTPAQAALQALEAAVAALLDREALALPVGTHDTVQAVVSTLCRPAVERARVHSGADLPVEQLGQLATKLQTLDRTGLLDRLDPGHADREPAGGEE